MTTKLKTLVRAPALTQSGYGVHSRQLIAALMNDPTLDLYLESVPWGACAYLTDKSEPTKALKQLAQRYAALQAQEPNTEFDLFISVTIPQEFERKGKINIGVTAAVETDRCSALWLEKCNQMDCIVVPSKHAYINLASTCMNWVNNQTQQQGTLKLEKPIVLCPEGFDKSVYYERDELKTRVADLDFPADFNFLVVGQWSASAQNFGEDRKNIANTILYFMRAFQGRKDVGLVLKVNMARYGDSDREFVTERIEAIKKNLPEGQCPPIHLVHSKLSDEEMGELYNHPKINAYLSLTHGEGFGLPALEAAACGLPVIATNWSGHLDFLHPEGTKEKLFSAVPYDLKPVPDACIWENVIIKDSQWAVVREDDAIHAMRKMVDAYRIPKQRAQKLAKIVSERFDLQTVQKQFLSVIQQVTKQFQKQNLSSPEDYAQIIDDPEAYNVLYTMPVSTGDVFISSAVIDGVVKSIKQEQENVHVYFATMPQYHSVLEDNPNVHKVINWQENMMDIHGLESVFDLVLTPNVNTQFTFSNWVRGGHGRLLAEEMANHCQVELGDYFIKEDDTVFTDILNSANGETDLRHVEYMTFAPGSGKGQWEARKYVEWPEVLANIKAAFPNLKIVQVGAEDESQFANVDFDMRGKTTVHQLASLVKNAKLHLSIDTFSMHLAASYHVPLVALFGSSHAGSTGPWYREPTKEAFVLLEAPQKMGCQRACYKYTCKVQPSLPCINEVDSAEVVNCVKALIEKTINLKAHKQEYTRIFPKISGYTTSYNAITMGYPFVESITSMLGFCDEVVVADFSTDGTYEVLQDLAAKDDRIQLFKREWDKENPGQDGEAKAWARAMTSHEFCWQQDLDEVVHEKDYEKIRWITKRFPGTDVLHLPVVEVWGDAEHATGRRHSWKWRLSKNDPNITHGININARVTDPETGLVHAKEHMSDGCEYVNQVTYEMMPHTGFYNQDIEDARVKNPEMYEAYMNQIIAQIPSVWHFSWASIPMKIEQFKINWDRQWSCLYQKDMPPRFPKDCNVDAIAAKLYEQGGEDSDPVKYKYKLKHSYPAIMKDWIETNIPRLKATG